MVSHQRVGRLNAKGCALRILPSVILGACDCKVYGAISSDVKVVREREWHLLELVCEDLGEATLRSNDHQSEIGVANV